MSDPTTAMAAGERLFRIVEEGDLAELREVFTPDAQVWHNTDDRLVDVETTIANLAKLRASAAALRYTEVRRVPTPDGFVQQHDLLVEMRDGRVVVDRACCVCRVEDGRVAWMDAYHDSAVTHAMAHRTPDPADAGSRAVMLVSMRIDDSGWMEDYFREVPALLAEHGAVQLVGGTQVSRVEGDGPVPDRVAAFAFPSREAIDAFLADERYQRHRVARQGGSRADIVVVDDAATSGGLA